MEGLERLVEGRLLTLIVFLPLAGSLALLLLEVAAGVLRGATAHFSDAAWRALGLAAALAGLGLALRLWLLFDPAAAGAQFVEREAWLGDWGPRYHVGVDGLSLLLALLACFLYPLALLASWGEAAGRARSLVFLLSALQTGLLGALLSLDLLAFYVFAEALVVPVYFLAGGGRAGARFFGVSALGGALLLLGILVLGGLHGQPAGGGQRWAGEGFLFGAFALALSLKAGLFPFHFWAGEATEESPAAVSAILAAVGLKLGLYGLVRFALPLFPLAAAAWAPWLAALAALGTLYAALLAFAQTDLKRLVVQLSIATLGLAALGAFALDPVALEGALLQMAHHGLAIGGLLLLAGMLGRRCDSPRIDDLDGLARDMPVFAAFFALVLASAAGAPALGGFAAGLPIVLGAYPRAPVPAALAVLALGLIAACAFRLLRRVFSGAPPAIGRRRQRVDLGPREKLVACALALATIWMGLHPMTFLKPVGRSVHDLVETLEPRAGERPDGGAGASPPPEPPSAGEDGN